jgi:hypothetical protein
MHLVFRDDDTSYFTSPAMLEQVYAPLWEKGLPVCLAVIPLHDANNVIPPYRGYTIDPNIPPAYRGMKQRFPITENRELCAFLNDLAEQNLVEICLHGYTHLRLECMTEDAAAFRRNIEAGLALFETAFPNIPIHTFITPYDQVSAPALEQIFDSGLNTCCFPVHLPQGFGPFAPNTASVCRGQTLIANETPEPLSEHDAWAAMLAQSSPDEVFVCLNHYYEFFEDWGAPQTAMLASWHDFLALTAPYADQVSTFAALRLT